MRIAESAATMALFRIILHVGRGIALALPAAAYAEPLMPDVSLRLPRDLSPWGMFMSADIVVKAVMVGLAVASLVTWTVWFAKTFALASARRRARRSLAVLAEATSLDAARAGLRGHGGDVPAFAEAAATEMRLSADAFDPAGVKERVASRLERIEAAAALHAIRGTGLLATIGATAPFVGLFGTVWGIMNSFIGISRQQTTIPAVVMYNLLSRWTARYRAELADAAAAVLRLVGRDLDRGLLERRAAFGRAAAE